MNPRRTIPVPASRLALLALAGSLVATPFAGAQTITNPSFEADSFSVDPGYVSDNGPITGWSGTDGTRYGLNPISSSSFANNGTIPNGSKVAFLLSGGSMSTTIGGLTAGTAYKVSFRVNTPAFTPTHNPVIKISTDGAGEPLEFRVNAAGAAGGSEPYKYIDYEFKATAAGQILTLLNESTGDNTLLLDDFSVKVSPGKWSFRRLTGDADSGVDKAYRYSHAYTFGGAATSTEVNGIPFAAIGGGNPTLAGKIAITGLPNGFGEAFGGARQVTGASNILVKSFVYGGPVTTLTIENLKPNTAYVATIYGIGFDLQPYGRASTFSSNLDPDNRLTIDVDQYNQTGGIAVDYSYTTDASGSAVVLTYVMPGDSSFHTSAFANREAQATNPQPAWTAAAWTDDSTAGVDGSYLYTHAYSLNSATSFLFNGVPFTGIGGANPADPGKFSTAGLGAVYANDANLLNTPSSRTLANDFLYNGFPAVVTLNGLTPGKEYVYTLYSVGWEGAGARLAAFQQNAPGDYSSPVLIDQDMFGDNAGIRFECRYTANSSGTASFMSMPYQPASIHHYGFTNHEAQPLANVPPTIALQPVGGTVGIGASFTFTSSAFGSAPITYQWKRNNVDVPGATNSSLTLTSITPAQAGTYTVVATNGSGSKASDPAELIVKDGVPALFDTGVGDDRVALPDGTADLHYLLLVNPDGDSLIPPVVEDSSAFPIVAGPWVANTATSKWVGPKLSTIASAGEGVDGGAGLGIYVYRTMVDLTGFDLSTVTLSGNWATDNDGVDIKVNDGVVANSSTRTGQYGAVCRLYSVHHQQCQRHSRGRGQHRGLLRKKSDRGRGLHRSPDFRFHGHRHHPGGHRSAHRRPAVRVDAGAECHGQPGRGRQRQLSSELPVVPE